LARKRTLELTILALLGALLFGAKMALAGLPNIEPVSLLILVYTAVFGRKALYPIYIYVLLELMVWGLGLWNLNYLYVWLVLYLLGRLLRRMDSAWGWAILSGGFGLSFGLLCTPVYCITGGWAFGLSWWISGIPFDVIHCVGNFCLALVLYRPLTAGLSRLKRKYLPES
jgi:energy-coupling factor transport system substrate-specific component